MKKIIVIFVCFLVLTFLWEHYERAVKIKPEYDVDYLTEYDDELQLFFNGDYQLSKERYYEYSSEPCWKYTIVYQQETEYKEFYSYIPFDENMLSIYDDYFMSWFLTKYDEDILCQVETSLQPVDYQLVNLYTEPVDQIFLEKQVIFKINTQSKETIETILEAFPHFSGSITYDDKTYYYIKGRRYEKNAYNHYLYDEKP